MLIFFQELIMQVFLWILRAIDGIMELFSALSGITKINYKGEQINLVEFLVGDSTISKVFWCVFILAIGLGCMFAIIALVKNMIANNRNISTIVGKFFLAMLGTLVMLIVVILGIIISNSLLVLIAEIFNIDTSVRLSETLFNICVGDWLNGYSVAEIDFNTITVRDILGEYDPNTVFSVFPTSWKMNGMVNPNTFMYFPALLMVFGVGFALIKAIAKLVKRVYELIFMYVTMPMFMSTLPLDDGARFRTWRETFVTKVVLTYGTVFSVSIFALILPMISSMQIDGISEFGNKLFQIFMLIGGTIMIPTGQALFSKLFGSGEFTDKSKTLSIKEVHNLMRTSYYTNAGSMYESNGSHKYSEDTRNFNTDDSGGDSL